MVTWAWWLEAKILRKVVLQEKDGWPLLWGKHIDPDHSIRKLVFLLLLLFSQFVICIWILIATLHRTSFILKKKNLIIKCSCLDLFSIIPESRIFLLLMTCFCSIFSYSNPLLWKRKGKKKLHDSLSLKSTRSFLSKGFKAACLMKNKRSGGKRLSCSGTTVLSLCSDKNMASGALMGFGAQIAHGTGTIQYRSTDSL